MTPSERLVARLRKECGLELPEGAYATRTYAGQHMRAAGAWVMRLHAADHSPIQPWTGSHWTITDLLRSQQLEVGLDRWGDRNIDPSAEDQRRWRARSRTV